MVKVTLGVQAVVLSGVADGAAVAEAVGAAVGAAVGEALGGHGTASPTYLVSFVRFVPLHADLAMKQQFLLVMLISAQPPNSAHACLHLSKLVLQMRHPPWSFESKAIFPSPSCLIAAASSLV